MNNAPSSEQIIHQGEQGPVAIGAASDTPNTARSGQSSGSHSPKPTVTFMITSLAFGGADKQLKDVAIRLARVGWRVKGVISLSSPVNWTDELRRAGIPVYSLGMTPRRPRPSSLFRAFRLLRQLQPDILVTFLFHASLIGWISAKCGGAQAVVCSVRSDRFGNWFRNMIVRLCAGLGDRCIVNSQYAAETLVARRVLPSGRCDIVPNGFEEPQESELPLLSRSDLDIPAETFVWLAVGWLIGAKDYPTMLRAFATIDDSKSQLLIAGTGPEDAKLRRLAADLNIDGRVRFLGLRKDVQALLRVADGFVSSSAWEGMPNAIMEAMASGTPVVATQVGGTGELIHNGQTGYLVSPKSTAALAIAMKRVMGTDPRQRHELGENGRRFVLNRYSWDRIVPEWEKALYTVMEAPK